MSNAIKKILQSSSYPDRATFEWGELEKAYRNKLGQGLPQGEALTCLATLFGRSFYLVRRLINIPEMAQRLFESAFLDKPKSRQCFMEELKASVETVQADRAALMRALRRYRYEETLRMTVRETAHRGGFEEWGQERSDLASACVEVAYQAVKSELVRDYGQAFDEGDSVPSRFSVIGMGKLGGGDLNHSSDIDIIYLYSSDEGGFKGREQDITHHQYFVRLGEILARLLSDFTEDGFVYRVDLDLRPEGRKGTLANSINAMESYYETFGDNWERMSLTKARTVAGSEELGMEFAKRVRPFVFPAISDFSTLAQIRDLKNRIEQSLEKKLTGGVDPKNSGYNVKLGIGGIREIEFFVGAMQRLYGGRDPELQERNTLRALLCLEKKELISEYDSRSLDEAYRFLRTAENNLQMLEEQQTHALPRGRDDLMALSRGFYSDEKPNVAFDRFQEQLLVHTEHVRSVFENFLSSS